MRTRGRCHEFFSRKYLATSDSQNPKLENDRAAEGSRQPPSTSICLRKNGYARRAGLVYSAKQPRRAARILAASGAFLRHQSPFLLSPDAILASSGNICTECG